jgi:hypothetical protein
MNIIILACAQGEIRRGFGFINEICLSTYIFLLQDSLIGME